jgi:diaminobutyrate-2-oxoglutarate transaminase
MQMGRLITESWLICQGSCLVTSGISSSHGQVRSVPGPQSEWFLERQSQLESNARSYPRQLPMALQSGNGSYVTDVDGNVYLDFLSGAGALSLGHSQPVVVEAVKAQLDLLTHGLDFPSPAKDEFVEAFLDMVSPLMGEDLRIHFCGPTGTNAVEAALKLCKIATGRNVVLAFRGSFHGNSAGSASVSANASLRGDLMLDAPGVHFMPYSFCHRCPLGLDASSCTTNCVSVLETALLDPNSGVGPPAAVILELVQGEGGVIPARVDFVRRVREITRSLGIPMIVDEIQTGCGRTGTWFCFEQFGIQPDVVICSKGISGIGIPLSLILYRAELDIWPPGAHTGTFRGNQLGLAAATATMRLFRSQDILGNVRRRGEEVRAALSRLRQDLQIVSDVRGLGLMWGIDLSTRDEAIGTRLATLVQRLALERGLIVETGGRLNSVVRLLPPLNVSRDEISHGLEILEAALREAEAQMKGVRS